MDKFRRLYAHLVEIGRARPSAVHEPQPADAAMLGRAHAVEYVEAVLNLSLDDRATRRIGFPLDPGVVMRSRCAVAGTLLTARLALAEGVACNTAGGSHHAFAGHGAGYCVFNDVAVASRVLLDEASVAQVLVIDLDVHQGDGTAAICSEDHDIFTFSMHCERNFPTTKQVSDRDVALPAGVADDEYLELLEDELSRVLPRVAPDIVFYNAGVDPHQDDRLGRLALTDAGLLRRDRAVMKACDGVPVAGVLGGGYTHDVEALVGRHALLFQAAAEHI
jgi:acetoin utilization deacetylase AcuC-like enzyme